MNSVVNGSTQHGVRHRARPPARPCGPWRGAGRRVRTRPDDLGGVRVEGEQQGGPPHRPRPRDRGHPISFECPRWTPSYMPMVTTVRPRSAGVASRPTPALHVSDVLRSGGAQAARCSQPRESAARPCWMSSRASRSCMVDRAGGAVGDRRSRRCVLDGADRVITAAVPQAKTSVSVPSRPGPFVEGRSAARCPVTQLRAIPAANHG